MWDNLPLDLLATIFSLLSPDSLARARSVCRQWCACGRTYPLPPSSTSPSSRRHPAWFVALPARSRGHCCYAYDPVCDRWHRPSLDFLPDPVRLLASLRGLLLLRLISTGAGAASTSLRVAVCNPFTRQFKRLPAMNFGRTNPAVGVVAPDSPPTHYRIYAAGGTSSASFGGAAYEATVEVYESMHDRWAVVGAMPVEFAVRLTVWTPNESVYCDGVLYWVTSARAYTIMGFHITSNAWKELHVPLADRLEFAALLKRDGKLALVGGAVDEGACIWQLSNEEQNAWSLVEKVPVELGMRLLGEKGSWRSARCAAGEEAICLYRDLGSGMAVCRESVDKGRWEWIWVQGFPSISINQPHDFPIKGVLLQPNLASHLV